MSAVLEGTDSSYYTFIYFHFLYKVCKYLSRALKMNINYINYNFALYSALVKLIFHFTIEDCVLQITYIL